jgi:hypothetical protein
MTTTRATVEAMEGKHGTLSDMHAAMQGHALSQSILPSWQGEVVLSASARDDISSALMWIADIVVD